MTTARPYVLEFVKRRAYCDAYAAYCRNILAELVQIDTSATCKPDHLRRNELAMFELIESCVCEVLSGCASARTISLAGSTDGTKAPQAVAPSVGPARSLIVDVPGENSEPAGRSVIWHAPISTANPWFRPRNEAEIVYGRGAVNAKGSIAALLGQIRLLEEIRRELGLSRSPGGHYRFFTDGTCAGHGTGESGYENVHPPAACAVVCAPTDNLPHISHRGELAFQCCVDARGRAGVNELWIVPFVIQALHEASRNLEHDTSPDQFDATATQLDVLRIRREQTPVADAQRLSVIISLRASASSQRIMMHLTELIEGCLGEVARGLAEGSALPPAFATRAGLATQYRLVPEVLPDRLGFRLDVFGSPIDSRQRRPMDNALTKGAHLLVAMLCAARNYPDLDGDVRLADGHAGPLVLDVRQTFAPPHTVASVEACLHEAVTRGLRAYCDFRGVEFDARLVQTSRASGSCDAYAGPRDSAALRAFQHAFHDLGHRWPELRAWPGCCDAHRFGRQGVPAVVFGPGHWLRASGADEHIAVHDIQEAVAIATLAALHLSRGVHVTAHLHG